MCHKGKAICNLKSFEWSALATLLHKGIAFRDAYALVRDEDHIEIYLEQGMEIEELLLHNKKGRFYEHLRFFLRLTDLANAIDAASQMSAFENGIKKKLIKQTSYPMLLFAMAFLTLYFFSVFIIPQLMQSFDMENDNHMLMTFVQLLETGSYVLMISLICIGIFVMICARKPALSLKVAKMCLRYISLPADICSYSLAGYMIQLQNQGVPTHSSFQFLSELQKNTWFSECVHSIRYGLENGDDLVDILSHESFISNEFLKAWQIGIHTTKLSDACMDFMRRQEEQWSRLIKHIGITIQCGAYSFVAVMVLVVYQIMLVPLEILETM